MTIRIPNKQKGISLLEVMLSLAIIAIILVMATRYFGLASRGSKINDATQQINEIRQGLTRYLNDKNTLTGVTLPALSNAGYITQQTGAGAGPWGPGTISITAAPTNATIQVHTGDDEAGCQNLANRFTNIGAVCAPSPVDNVVTINNAIQ